MSESIKLLLSLSLSGTILSGMIFLLKPFVKNKISKSIQYYIWLVVLLRLVMPFSFESSLMNALFYDDSEIVEVQKEDIKKSAVALEDVIEVINPSESSSVPNVQKNVEIGIYKNDKDHSRFIQDILNKYALYLWIFGIIVVLLFNILGYLYFSRRLRLSNTEVSDNENRLLKDLLKGKYRGVRIKRNSSINTPMLIGIINPSILVPDNDYSIDQLRNILSHEITHLKRKDILIKWVTMIVATVHWFNPFMYFIKKEINSACELACDEAVIKNLSAKEKQAYGETLISVVSEQKCPNGMIQATMCEEKKSLKERLVAIMEHKKKSKVVIILSVGLLIGAVGGAMFLGAGVGVIEKEPPNLYLAYGDKESKVAITGTYGWKWSGGGVQSDSPIPYEFDFNENNILNVAQGARIEINFKGKNDLNSKNYDYEIVEGRLYKNQKEILYKPLPNLIDGKMTIITPLVEGTYVCSLLVDFQGKGKVTYGFVVKVVDSSTHTYRSKYGWEINYPKDMDIIGENFIMKSKTDKYLSFKVLEDISEDKLDGVIKGEIKRILGGSEGLNTIQESLKRNEKDGFSVFSFSHKSKIESKTTLIKHTYIYYKKNIYMFNGQIPDLTEEEYENIVNSFKIVDKKIQTSNFDILDEIRGDWIEKNRYIEILNKNINNPILNISSQYKISFKTFDAKNENGGYQKFSFDLNFFDTAIGGNIEEFREIAARKYFFELETGFQATLEFNESMNEVVFSSEGLDTLTYKKSGKLDMVFSKFMLPGVYIDNSGREYSFSGDIAKFPEKEFKYEIKELQAREFFMLENEGNDEDKKLPYYIKMIDGKMYFYLVKNIPKVGSGEEVEEVKFLFELDNRDRRNFREWKVLKKNVAKLSEEGIFRVLFTEYLESYLDIQDGYSMKIYDYRIEDIVKWEHIPKDMQKYGTIYNITYSVKSKGKGWGPGNGSLKDDGWIENKSFFVTISEDDESYELLILGTGL